MQGKGFHHIDMRSDQPHQTTQISKSLQTYILIEQTMIFTFSLWVPLWASVSTLTHLFGSNVEFLTPFVASAYPKGCAISPSDFPGCVIYLSGYESVTSGKKTQTNSRRCHQNDWEPSNVKIKNKIAHSMWRKEEIKIRTPKVGLSSYLDHIDFHNVNRRTLPPPTLATFTEIKARHVARVLFENISLHCSA